MKLKACLVALAVWFTASLTFAAAPPDDYSISTNVIASGGHTSVAAAYTFMSTVGEPAVGMSTSSTYNSCSGYWCGISFRHLRIFLPAVKRN